jgi:prophage DNA circulation protein
VSWKEQLLPASFRGVPFFVDVADFETGRRVAQHDIPFSEEPPVTQDLGKVGGSHPIDGYVIGDDYMAKRDALLAALAGTLGPGELVHPYLGTKRIQVGRVKVRHEAREGGICRFTISFTETSSSLPSPSVSIDAPTKLVASASAAKAAATTQFLTVFDDAAQLRDSVSGALTAATGQISSVLGKVAIAGQTLASLTAQLDGLNDSIATLLDAPDELVDSLTGIIETFAGGLLLVEGSLNPLAWMLTLVTADFGVQPPADTPSRAAEQVNFNAVVNVVKRLALAQASLMVVEQTFASFDDAIAVRGSILELLDEHTDEAADDVFPQLQDMRRDLVRAVPGEESDLPRLARHTPPATLPSLVLAHQLYGHLDLERDLVRRNRIANPMFVKGGEELEVLTDGE